MVLKSVACVSATGFINICYFVCFVCHFQKSWDIALGPFKQIPMNLFIMYMAGNSISIFPIMMVGMMFLRPVKALLAVKSSKNVLGLFLFFNGQDVSRYVASCITATPTCTQFIEF